MSVSKTRHDLILKWHDQGYSVDETARLLQVSHEEITAIINNREKEPTHVPQLPNPNDERQTTLPGL